MKFGGIATLILFGYLVGVQPMADARVFGGRENRCPPLQKLLEVLTGKNQKSSQVRTKVEPDPEHVALLNQLALEEDVIEIARENTIKLLDASTYPNLRNTVVPINTLKDERGLIGWRTILTPDERKQAIEKAFVHNQRTSRTVSLGQSGKNFVEDVSTVKGQATKNYFKAIEAVQDWSRKPVTKKELKRQILKLNEMLTEGLSPIERGKVGKPGQIRNFMIGLEERAGLTPNDLSKRFDDFIDELYDRMNESGADPIATSAWAYMKLSEEIKPFFDGNGRTGHALVDYLLTRSDYPIPTYIGASKFDPIRKKIQGRHGLAMMSQDTFQEYLDHSVKETIRSALKDKPISEAIKTNANGRQYLALKKLGSGTRSSSYLSKAGAGTEVTLKIADNHSAFAEMKKEAEVIRYFNDHPDYRIDAPIVHHLDPDGRWMVKDYRHGVLGDQIRLQKKLSADQINKLKETYESVKTARNQAGIQLDFIPSNVVWDKKSERWQFVDFGPRMTPLPLQSFDTYLEEIWKIDPRGNLTKSQIEKRFLEVKTPHQLRQLYQTAGENYGDVSDLMLKDLLARSTQLKAELKASKHPTSYDYVFVGAGIHTGISKATMASSLGSDFKKLKVLTVEASESVSVFGEMGKTYRGNTKEHSNISLGNLSRDELLKESKNFQAGSGIQIADVAHDAIPVADQFEVPAISNHWLTKGDFLFGNGVQKVEKTRPTVEGAAYKITMQDGETVYAKNIVMGPGLGEGRLPTRDPKSLAFIQEQRSAPTPSVFFVEDLLKMIEKKQSKGLPFMDQFAHQKGIIVGGGHGGAIGLEAIEGLGPEALYRTTGGLDPSKTPSSYLWVNLPANTGEEFKQVIGGGSRYHGIAPLIDQRKIKTNQYYLHEVLPGDGGKGIKVSFLDKATKLPVTDAQGKIIYESGDFLIYAVGYESSLPGILTPFKQGESLDFQPVLKEITPNDPRVVHSEPVTVGTRLHSGKKPENIFVVGPGAGQIPHPNDPGGVESVTINVFGPRSESMGKFLAEEKKKAKKNK